MPYVLLKINSAYALNILWSGEILGDFLQAMEMREETTQQDHVEY